MVVKLYMSAVSPPCRAVLMTATQIGIELEIEENLSDSKTQEELIKINPRACVPTIDDNGFHLWESRAIMTYLVNKYAPCDPLYPRDPEKRAMVDMMLCYDQGTLYKAQVDYLYPVVFQMPTLSRKVTELAYKNALAFLDSTLSKQNYLAGDHLTLADLSIAANVSLAEVYDFDFSAYRHLQLWMHTMKESLPYYNEINVIPVFQFKFSAGKNQIFLYDNNNSSRL